MEIYVCLSKSKQKFGESEDLFYIKESTFTHIHKQAKF